MANVNITEVRLLAVPLENDYLHTIYFSSASEQTEYFSSKTKKSGADFSYQRKDEIIRWPAHFDSLIGCNYVMYRNSAYGSKWFYAFITEMSYVDDGRTDIRIETDVIQTWMFDYTVKTSFVEREHVSDDSIGAHTVPEQVETGDYISNSHTRDENLDDLYIVIGVTSKSDGTRVGGFNYNGVYSGTFYYACPSSKASLVTDFLKEYDEGSIDAVQCVFLAPKFLVANDNFDGVQAIANSDTARTYDILIEKQKTINGYTPKNNKLLTYPYNYLYVSNNNGGGAVYPYEYFTNEKSAEFRVKGAVTPSCSIRMTPIHYKGVEHYDEESLNMGKFPVCNWSSDVYTNWLTQNAVNIAVSIGSSLVQTGIGVAGAALSGATGGVSMLMGAGALASGVSGISSAVGEIYAHSMQPPQANGNINCGDVITSSKRNSFHFYKMSIKKEYARIVDEYFNMFGYKVNRVKIPAANHRKSYWYTKTIDVNIDGNIPGEDMQKIKNCYNKGITFWKKNVSIGNYTVDNSITVTTGGGEEINV